MLDLRNLVSAYGNILALQGVSLHVKPSEIVTILGSNGAGKTTLLMAVAGLVPPRQGEILWEGRPIQQLTPDQIKALGIGLVPEGRRIFPEFTMLENLRMGAYLRRVREPSRRFGASDGALSDLNQRQSQLGGTLSGGGQQMLATRALMGRPNYYCSMNHLSDWPPWSCSKSLRSCVKSTSNNKRQSLVQLKRTPGSPVRRPWLSPGKWQNSIDRYRS